MILCAQRRSLSIRGTRTNANGESRPTESASNPASVHARHVAEHHHPAFCTGRSHSMLKGATV